MANLFQRISSKPEPQRAVLPLTFADFASYFQYGNANYPFMLNQTMAGQAAEDIPPDFRGLTQMAYKRNGVVFAVILSRMLLFAQARFAFQQLVKGRPGDLFGTEALRPLESPEPGKPTGWLASRAEQDVSLAGNFYATNYYPGVIKRLRPDWVSILMGSMEDPSLAPYDIGAKVVGYAYHPGGPGSGIDPIGLRPEQVAHYAPVPDPDAYYRGMSWLTPIVQEIQADQAATGHKKAMFENGAPQPLDAKVLTPTGWTTMGEVEIGDEVIGRDGQGHSVVAVYPQGERDIYRVGFSDGATTECTEDHIWPVATATQRKAGQHQTMTLRQIMDAGLYFPSGPHRWSVPFVEPVEYEEQPDPLPLDPYLLGALLGDGSSRGNGRGSGGITLANAAADADEMQAAVEPLLPAGVSVSRRDRGGWSEFYFKGGGSPAPNPLTTAIRELGLWDVLGGKKFIPAAYLTAAISERVALLQGLIDTDGHIEKRRGSSVRLTTTSAVLAEQVTSLVGGLGGSASIAKHPSRSTYAVDIRRLPDWIIPCRLARKVAAYLPLQRGGRRRFITSVEHVGRKQAQCISVDAPENLYVTDDYIVTHNTPNTIVTLAETDPDKFNRWVEKFREDHEGAANAYRCLHPETEVALWNGARCRADEVCEGDTIVAWTDGRPVPGVVSAVEMQPESPIVTITTQRGRVIKTNEPHPFLTKDGWIAAGDLEPGSLLTTGLGWGRPRFQDTLDEKEAWLLGLLVGDGCFVSSTAGVTISNQGVLARAGAQSDLVKLPHRSNAPYDYRVRGISDLVRTQSLNGKRSYEKRVPAGVMTGGEKVVGAFFSGLVDADGHVSDPKIRSTAEVGITSTSLGLLTDVQHLLASLGVNASVSSPPSMRVGADGGGSGHPRRHDAHRLSVFGNRQAARLAELLDLADSEKGKRLKFYASAVSKEDRSRYDRVVSVTVGRPERTVGIEVAGHHTHITGGVVTHNTLFLGAGADATVIGTNLQEMDFRRVQGGGETRVAAAGGVPPVIVGLSEGLAAATYANYGQARRRFADGPQPLDAGVLTPGGWSLMGEMTVGSRVIGHDGAAHTVVGVYDQGDRDIYSVEFIDGGRGECSLDHMWTVSTEGQRRRGSSQTISLREMISRGFRSADGGAPTFAVPLPDPVVYAEAPALPIDPYLIGLLIGDATFRGVGTADKFIRASYLRAHVADRVALLQGLVDSDGCVTKEGDVRFTNTSPALLAGVVELVRSLGGIATVRRFQRGGASDVGVSRLPEWIVPTRLERKRERYLRALPRTWSRYRSIVGATLVRSAPTRCIKINTPEGLYLTDDFIVTHNTMRPLWECWAGAFSLMVPAPGGSRLWYDVRDVSFLQEDEKDAADIQFVQAQALRQLVDSGWDPESAIAFVSTNDVNRLKHTGRPSVQLQGVRPLPPAQSDQSTSPDPTTSK